ncbi:sigma-70 family RNA polymerase sigma factor [candidate division WOR-3 bacterium]|uniref:Sigma-70 family RNA polymerase sigma factor n=1 Tax=candidate division WOR-3 bacterium TaxID=2052148 RepID=A0A9D5QF03_UNCW3|nr:sigma-70 family RNA polymerase sigma factor [candidate division WOR-3 bacterium]MBD3365520.1 sigma-70 family RNA polymerase sigma factor [candidate division WOR-3 bacterium]
MLRWVSDKSLSRYFKEIMRYPLLSRTEEQEIAHRAKLGDVICKINGKGCSSLRTVRGQVRRAGAGAKIPLVIRRGDEEIEKKIEIPVLSPQKGEESDSGILGMRLKPVSELDRHEIDILGIKKGILVEEIIPDSPADRADILDYNRKARDKLILHNLRWVVSIAKQYQRRGLPLAELINEGNLGLIQAVSKFDVNRKTRLTTYSNWWIRYYIVSALASRHLIKMPIKLRTLAKRVRDTYGILSQRLERAPSIDELATELDVEPEEVSCAFDCGVAELSIDAMPFEDSKVTFGEVLKDTSASSPAEISAKEQIERNVRSSLNEVLADRELYVVSRHFGVPLPADRKFPIRKITEIFGRTEEEISKILYRACRRVLSRMCHNLGENELKRFARFSKADARINCDIIKNRLPDPRKELLKVTRKLVKNVSSALNEELEEIEIEDREVFRLYWGLNPTYGELNLRELGDLLGVSREAARQIKQRAIRKLKKHLRPQAFDNFFREAV